MATLKFSIAIQFMLCHTILFSSGVMVMNAKEDCMEGYPWVKVVCDGAEIDAPCWKVCRSRHGVGAKAWCHEPSPAFPTYQVCFCSWPC